MAGRRYAALWSEGGRRHLVGSVQLGSSTLSLEGSAPGFEAREQIRYSDITALELDRSSGGRVGGRTALVLVVGERRVRLGLTETGATHELVDELTARGASRREPECDPPLVDHRAVGG
ncbi:MAG: hypothetical protein ACYDA3_13275 [Gaiellaceae bacterium]